MRQQRKRAFSDYLIAFISVALAFGVTMMLYHFYAPFRQHGLFGLLLAAVSISAWRGGLGPALFATFLSVAAAQWILPSEARAYQMDDYIRICMFVLIAVLISSMHAARDRAERELQESERRLNFAMESSGVACWDVDVASGSFWKSQNLPAIFGRSVADFATTYEGFFAYIHPEDRDFFRVASVGMGKVMRDYEVEHRIILADGSIRRVMTRGRMYLDERGKVERMVGMVYAMPKPEAEPQPMPVKVTA